MNFKEWWDTVGSDIRPAISSDIESHARFVANAAWNAAQQNTKVAEQTPTNSKSTKLPDKLLNFLCYLVDNCEGETITEEYLLQVGYEFIRSR